MKLLLLMLAFLGMLVSQAEALPGYCKHHPDRVGCTTPPPADPPPSSSGVSWVNGWGSFDSDSHVFPGAAWRPYGDGAWLNRPLPEAPRLVSNSAAMVARTFAAGESAWDTIAVGQTGTQDWDMPYTAPDADDPLYTIHCWRYPCASIEGKQVRIPVGARPAQGTDRNLAVFSGDYIYDLYKVETDGAAGGSVSNWSKLRNPSGGTLYVGSGGRGLVSGDGRDEGGDGALAAKIGTLAGSIRGEELENGAIPHALNIVVGCTNGTVVYPAQGRAGVCSDTTNAPPTGQVFRLKLTEAQIDALSAPAWRKVILRTLRRYGAVVADTGGAGMGRFHSRQVSDRSYYDYGVEGALARFARLHSGEGGITQSSSTPGKFYLSMVTSGLNFSAALEAVAPCVLQATCG